MVRSLDVLRHKNTSVDRSSRGTNIFKYAALVNLDSNFYITVTCWTGKPGKWIRISIKNLTLSNKSVSMRLWYK